MAWRIGIDIGGTFTDVALVEEGSGRIAIAKLPTTPRDFGQAVIDGIRQGLDANRIDPADVSLISHATTVVTNALLENKGARAGFVATRGMRDLLELRRSSRADLYDLLQDAPAVLVPRRWRFEITERIDAQGEVVTPLAEDELPGLIEAIREAGLQTVAVSFLFSFLNDAHERRVGEALRAALPDVGVYLSSEVLPEIREFERASTTAVCAVVGPVLASYLDRLQAAISAARSAEAACDGLVGRRVRHRGRAAHAGDGGGIRSRGRCDRRVARRQAVGATQSDFVRHGRHDGEGQRDRQWRGVGHRRIRGGWLRPRQSLDARHRPSDPRAGDRSCGSERRRRFDRVGRSRWRAEGGAAQRRRRTGSGVLRRRRHAADGDRCRCGAGLSRSRGTARRRAAGRSRRRGARDRDRDRPSAGSYGAGSRRAHRRGGQRQHGAGAAHRVDRARPRSSGVRPDRVRRRGSGARGGAR